jgi:hypothetical protein
MRPCRWKQSSRAPDPSIHRKCVSFPSFKGFGGHLIGRPGVNEPLESRMITDRRLHVTHDLLTASNAERRLPGRRKRNLARLERKKARERSRMSVRIDDEISDVIDADFDELACEPETLLRLANQL